MEFNIYKESGVNSSMSYLIHGKNLCKCHNVPPPSATIKEKKKTKYVMIMFFSSNIYFLYFWMHEFIKI
jgi:hypothetical protein